MSLQCHRIGNLANFSPVRTWKVVEKPTLVTRDFTGKFFNTVSSFEIENITSFYNWCYMVRLNSGTTRWDEQGRLHLDTNRDGTPNQNKMAGCFPRSVFYWELKGRSQVTSSGKTDNVTGLDSCHCRDSARTGKPTTTYPVVHAGKLSFIINFVKTA